MTTKKPTPPDATLIRKSQHTSDQQLLEPLHDEMMVWVDRHALQIVRDLGLYKTYTDPMTHQEIEINVAQPVSVERIDSLRVVAQNMIVERRRQLRENTAVVRSDFHLSAADLGEPFRTQYEHNYETYCGKLETWVDLPPLQPPTGTLLAMPCMKQEVVWQAVVQSEPKMIYSDLMVHWSNFALGLSGSYHGTTIPDWQWTELKSKYWFEIEPRISSVGDLIRRLRFYQTLENHSYLTVVTPESQWVEVLEEQGFGFVVYEPDRYPLNDDDFIADLVAQQARPPSQRRAK